MQSNKKNPDVFVTSKDGVLIKSKLLLGSEAEPIYPPIFLVTSDDGILVKSKLLPESEAELIYPQVAHLPIGAASSIMLVPKGLDFYITGDGKTTVVNWRNCTAEAFVGNDPILFCNATNQLWAVGENLEPCCEFHVLRADSPLPTIGTLNFNAEFYQRLVNWYNQIYGSISGTEFFLLFVGEGIEIPTAEPVPSLNFENLSAFLIVDYGVHGTMNDQPFWAGYNDEGLDLPEELSGVGEFIVYHKDPHQDPV